MIKFFRHIRQRLLLEGKIGRYFKYAIGEIALVMIGILLALQVSNWNELHKAQKLEKRYLSELILDLQTDSLSISNFVTQSDLQKHYKEKLIDIFNNETTYSEDSLNIYFNTQWQTTYSFNPITTTLDEMKSTGNIGLIKNSDLRRRILETYNNYEIHINQHERIYNRQQEEIWKLLFSTVPYLYTGPFETKGKVDIETVITNFEVQNRINGNYVMGFNDAIHQLQEWNSGLIKAIREESKSLK
jgi:hypothetical protein